MNKKSKKQLVWEGITLQALIVVIFLFDIHQGIRAAMTPYGWLSPEFKTDSIDRIVRCSRS
jgi:hypothetical protein